MTKPPSCPGRILCLLLLCFLLACPAPALADAAPGLEQLNVYDSQQEHDFVGRSFLAERFDYKINDLSNAAVDYYIYYQAQGCSVTLQGSNCRELDGGWQLSMQPNSRQTLNLQVRSGKQTTVYTLLFNLGYCDFYPCTANAADIYNLSDRDDESFLTGYGNSYYAQGSLGPAYYEAGYYGMWNGADGQHAMVYYEGEPDPISDFELGEYGADAIHGAGVYQAGWYYANSRKDELFGLYYYGTEFNGSGLQADYRSSMQSLLQPQPSLTAPSQLSPTAPPLPPTALSAPQQEVLDLPTQTQEQLEQLQTDEILPDAELTMETQAATMAEQRHIIMYLDAAFMLINNSYLACDAAAYLHTVNGMGYTMVPVRHIAEALGAVVGWEQATQTVSISFNGSLRQLTIGQNAPNTEVAALIRNSRTYVPLRYVMESFGAVVSWDAAQRRVDIIYTPPLEQ